jgi:hypothetical protein
MEYAEQIQNSEHINESYERNVLYSDNSTQLQDYFSQNTINIISKKVTELLAGVDHMNRKIVVPDKTIANILDSIYTNYRPPTGDIYGRYNVPSGSTTNNYITDMIDQTIQAIYADVKNNLEIEYNNSKLSVWNTVLGNFNSNQLRSHPVIKIREKRPQPMLFNMNY